MLAVVFDSKTQRPRAQILPIKFDADLPTARAALQFVVEQAQTFGSGYDLERRALKALLAFNTGKKPKK